MLFSPEIAFSESLIRNYIVIQGIQICIHFVKISLVFCKVLIFKITQIVKENPMSDRQLADWRQHALTLETEVNKVVVGQANPVRLITTAIFARG